MPRAAHWMGAGWHPCPGSAAPCPPSCNFAAWRPGRGLRLAPPACQSGQGWEQPQAFPRDAFEGWRDWQILWVEQQPGFNANLWPWTSHPWKGHRAWIPWGECLRLWRSQHHRPNEGASWDVILGCGTPVSNWEGLAQARASW